ncbi:MAG: PilN domain-containing protein [Gemmatimonadaceae bacterium]
MIEINLLPGTRKKGKARSAASLKSAFGGMAQRIKNAYLVTAIASLAIAVAAVGGLYLTQQAEASELAAREGTAVRDSTRFAAVIGERRRLEAKRDSVVRQLDIIKAIDNDRFLWPHVLDEVSRALPPYTWLKSVAVVTSQAAPTQPVQPPKPDEKPVMKDVEPTSIDPVRFKVVGNTVDIQALTRFMKMLEVSPFVQKVQLARSELVIVDGKELTEFTLDAEYERPAKDAIVTAPVSLSVR